MHSNKIQSLKLKIANGLIRIFGMRNFQKWYGTYTAIRSLRTPWGVQHVVRRSPETLFRGNGFDKLQLNFGKRSDLLPYLRRNVSMPYTDAAPLVSIIIINRNGLNYLKTLYSAIQAYTIYPNYEIILADNYSSDDSCRFTERFGFPRCKVLRFAENFSFSKANNLAAQEALGEYLVFLNNDTEVCYGWLTEMMRCFDANLHIGCIGSTLVYAELEGTDKGGDWVLPGLSVQHAGCAFRHEGDFIRPYNRGQFRHPLYLSQDPESCPAVSAACQLWKRTVFQEIGGFDEGYVYGYEDIDICLKARQAGYEIMHCPTSVVLHHEFGTQKTTLPQKKQENRLKNMAHFSSRWFDELHREFWNEKLHGSPLLSEHPLTIAITVTEFHPLTTCGDYFSAIGLGNALERLGYRVIYLARRPVNEWYDVPDSVDVLLVMMDDYRPDQANIRKGILKVAWVRNWIDRWQQRPWLQSYDMVLTSSNTSLKVLSDFLKPEQYRGILRLAADTDQFKGSLPQSKYESDICFVGNIFHVPRDITENLALKHNWNFRFWGRLESPGHPFSPYHEGRLPYSEVPAVYNSAKIVMEDCTPMCKPWGCINSRTFEAMACGACVISNAVPELEDLFPNEILIYHDAAELERMLEYYLTHVDERTALGEKARQAILAGHTFDHRAREFREHLAAFLKISRSAVR